MTTTQKAFNNIQARIEELKALKSTSYSIAFSIKELENKLAEISMELTAERHATQY